MSKETLVLYHLENCPYCSLVRRKLDLLQLSYRVITVNQDRSEVERLSGQKGVPMLLDGDKAVSGSGEIITHLDQAYGDGKNQPLPGRSYGMSCVVEGTYAQVREKAIAVFKKQGFGLITEIDVQATMKAKLNLEGEPHGILGFCNPKIAHQAMQTEFEIGLLLPCNVIIREKSPGKYLVSALHPLKLFTLVGRNDILPMAEKVTELLHDGIAELEAVM